MENYTPKIHKDRSFWFAEMLIAVKGCHFCEKPMIFKTGQGLFPPQFHIRLDDQMKNAGIVFMGTIRVDNKEICVECEAAGKADFKCELCEQRYLSDQKKESFGYPAEYLCKKCYEITPAKIWDEKVSQLESEHRYDFD